MAKKIRLNKTHREVIRNFGFDHIKSSIDRGKEQKQLDIMLKEANAALRAKYPEKDMAVLRKYNQTRVDRCLKLQFPSGRVDGFTFGSDCDVVDVPRRAGCSYYNSEVFTVSEKFEKAFDLHAKCKEDADKKQRQKQSEFASFLEACKYIEDVTEVIALPEDVLKRLGHGSTALVAVTPETVKSLKATFKKAA